MPGKVEFPPLVYNDPIYDRREITAPVILALLQTQAISRLKGIMQHGITGLIGVTNQTTRFDHSLGAMALVERLGGSLQEQIAALLHDVSHTALSHVIDYVYDQHDDQSYHEEMKTWYVEQSDLPQTLADHGFDWRDFLEDEAYTLLEQPAPALCADRVDYFLRDGADLGLLTQADISFILAHLIVHQNRIVVDSVEAAKLMAYQYMAADDASWSNFVEVGLYELTAQAIRTGLRLGAISEADFWTIDQTLWDKLTGYDETTLQNWLRWISPDTQFIWDEATPTFRVSSKIRTIDPDILIEDQLRPLSEIEPTYAADRAAYLRRKQGKWPVRVVGFGEAV